MLITDIDKPVERSGRPEEGGIGLVPAITLMVAGATLVELLRSDRNPDVTIVQNIEVPA